MANIAGYHKSDTTTKVEWRSECCQSYNGDEQNLIWDMMVNLEDKSKKLEFIIVKKPKKPKKPSERNDNFSLPILSKNGQWIPYFIMYVSAIYKNTTMTVSKIHHEYFGKKLPEDNEFVSFDTIPSKKNS